jgi:RNA polymerase sigma-70 factor, ECF subfamily
MSKLAEDTRISEEVDALAAAVPDGDETSFSRLVGRYRTELQLHCRRMLGSVDDSEDLVQETFLRAWRWRRSFRGDSTFRTWLYRIATNACLDVLERRPRVPQAIEDPDVARMLEEHIRAPEAEPDAAVLAKETFEVAFMVAIQHLPPKQRAVLLLRGVLELSARDAASVLDTSVSSVNSALQRARRTVRDRLPEERLEWSLGSDATEGERVLLRRYVEATERGDPDAFIDTLSTTVPLSACPEFQSPKPTQGDE